MTSGITRRTTVKTAIGATGALALGIPTLSGTAAAAGTSDESAGVPHPKQQTDPTLRYDAPAANWEGESLPIGGGALGASVYGTLASEQLTFNEKTLWTGGPGSVQGYDFGNWTAPGPAPSPVYSNGWTARAASARTPSPPNSDRRGAATAPTRSSAICGWTCRTRRPPPTPPTVAPSICATPSPPSPTPTKGPATHGSSSPRTRAGSSPGASPPTVRGGSPSPCATPHPAATAPSPPTAAGSPYAARWRTTACASRPRSAS